MTAQLQQRLGLPLQREAALPLWTASEPGASLEFREGDAVHRRLVSILGSATDLSCASEELAQAGRRLSLDYHLSAERSNLLRAFQWRGDAQVIEIGAGCGAVSRYLAETFDELVAVEGDPARALAAATRLRDRPGARVVNARLDALSPTRPFDVAVAIGVLEYAALYGDEADPFRAFLERMRGLVHEQGLLVLAIENKLGLKYFAGAREDHSGIRFDSVEGYHRSGGRTARTFGHQELLALLTAAGFQTAITHFPFPDYKFTRSLVAANLGPLPIGPKLAELVGGGRPQLSAGGAAFDPALAWPELLANGLLEGLANSFLVLASPADRLPDLVSWDWDAVSLSTGRRPCYWAATEVHGLEGTSPSVRKRRIGADAPAPSALAQREYVDPWYELPSLEALAVQAMQDHHCTTADVAGLLAPWLRFLEQQAMAGQLPGELLDATPENGVLVDDAYRLLDREFAWAGTVELRVTIARSLYYLALRAAVRPGALRRYPGASVLGLMRRLARELGMSDFGWRDVRAFLRHEARLQHVVSGHPPRLTVRGLLRGLMVRVPLSPGAGRRPVIAGRVSRYLREARATLGL